MQSLPGLSECDCKLLTGSVQLAFVVIKGELREGNTVLLSLIKWLKGEVLIDPVSKWFDWGAYLDFLRLNFIFLHFEFLVIRLELLGFFRQLLACVE